MTARYVYCLVRTGGSGGSGGTDGVDAVDADPDSLDADPDSLDADVEAFDAAGLDDEPTRVIEADPGGGADGGGAGADGGDAGRDDAGADGAGSNTRVGAVVHDCESLYDTDDESQLRLWLLAHQRVVDEATAAFGTPLPVRFDTVIEGDDAAVRRWLADVADEARAALDRLAGTREYRVTAHWTPDEGGDEEGDADVGGGEEADVGAVDGDEASKASGADDAGSAEPGSFEARARETDDRLAELAAERDEASQGRAFLVGKQYDRRLRELRRERLADLAADLRERIEPVAREVRDADGGGHGGGTAGGDLAADADGEEVASLTVLAAASEEAELGARLDEYVAAHDVTVRFTGPWAPYSFAPELS